MFIIWGTKSREEAGGIVGDWCEACRAPNFHRLTHYFKVSHVYYIPLGKGQYAATTRQCTQCGTTSVCNATAYPRTLTHQEALGLSIEQVLEATNPALFAQVQKQRALEYTVAQRIRGAPAPAPSLPAMGAMDMPGLPIPNPAARPADQRMLDALQALGTMDARHKDVSQFLDRLQKWDYLTPSESEVLLHEINSFLTEDRNVNSTLNFIRLLPAPVSSMIGYAIWLAGVVIFALVFASLPFLQTLAGGAVCLTLTLALCVYASKRAARRAVCGWVAKTLVPGLRQSGVSAEYFVGLLAAVKASGRGQEEKIAAMTRNLNLITEELLRHGLLARQESAAPALLTSPPLQQ